MEVYKTSTGDIIIYIHQSLMKMFVFDWEQEEDYDPIPKKSLFDIMIGKMSWIKRKTYKEMIAEDNV
jgi:hypothetical protein